MARAGYDPRDMANMFQTIQAKGGGGGPEWMSSHPNPGNRYDAISKEAAQLRVTNPVRNTQEFTQVRSRLAAHGAGADDRAGDEATAAATAGPAATPAIRRARSAEWNRRQASIETFDGGNLFRIAVPSNWRELQGDNSVTFAPEGGYGDIPGAERVHARLAGRHGRQQRARSSYRRQHS